MATVKAVLNKDREKKCGGYSLVIQVIHKRVKRVVYTPYVLHEDEFDVHRQRAVRIPGSSLSYKLIKDINTFIVRRKQEIEDVIETVSLQNKNFVVQDVLGNYRQNQKHKYLIVYIEYLIEQKERMGKMGTARAFRSTLRSLQKFIANRELRFSDIDHRFIMEYETFLEMGGAKQNTVCFYLRNLRTIYNLAYNNGIEGEGYNAFQRIRIAQCKTSKRALGRDVINKIATVDLSHDLTLDRARDLFLFSFYARGMPFVDIIYLQKSDIENNTIRYKRQKTKQHMTVAITTPLRHIIEKYHDSQEFVLPFINDSDHKTLYEKYQAAYTKYHRYLKRLQKYLDVPTPLTMHVARHSWATIAKEQGASVTQISEGLGHTSEKTTAIYLKEFDNSVINKINEQVVAFSLC